MVFCNVSCWLLYQSDLIVFSLKLVVFIQQMLLCDKAVAALIYQIHKVL